MEDDIDSLPSVYSATKDIKIGNNVITKYVVNKIASYYEGKEIFEDDGSIEHILPESNDTKNNNIGNLILLEQVLNREANCLEYIDKITVYKKSSYKWIKEFLDSNTEWSHDKIQERSKKLSKFYYTKILAKDISLNALKR